ncbi:MAG: hypothetical protein Q7J63_10770 [Rhodonellum sp.]|nr:hypothetical protein [Rhodonellum sp.]
MKQHAGKILGNKGRSGPNQRSIKNGNQASPLYFLDKRLETSLQENLTKAANSSPHASQSTQLQAMANNYALKQQGFIQKKEKHRSSASPTKTESINQVQSLSPSQGTIQRVTNEEVESVIGPADNGSKTKIVDDLAKKSGGKEINFGNSPSGAPWEDREKEVKKAATDLSYSNEAADRLVRKDPYRLDEFEQHSRVHKKDFSVTTFEEFATDIFIPQVHQLYFHNIFKNGNWEMHDNFRNPYMAKFFANEAIQKQKEILGNATVAENIGLKTLKRMNVVSDSGKKWKRDHSIKNGVLDQPDFESFMRTENGKNSLRVAQDMGMECTGGEVCNAIDGNDGGFEIKLTCEAIKNNL